MLISLCLTEQEDQLPQRNSASAAYVYLGWLTDRAMHSRRIAEVVLFFWHSNALLEEVLAENGFDVKQPLKVILGDSFCISYRSTCVSISPYIILLAFSLRIPKKWSLKSPKIAFVDNLTHISRPRQEEPPRISPYTLYFQKLKVIQGRWFWYQSKAHMRLPISH